MCLKKKLNVSRPSEHPPVRGTNVKTFRWDPRLQRQNLFMAFKLLFAVVYVLVVVMTHDRQRMQVVDQPGRVVSHACTASK